MILCVSRRAAFGLGKTPVPEIALVAGQGVEGDAHAGPLVRHRYLAKRDPTRANLRQVHLIEADLLDELRVAGFAVGPGVLGENITTQGIALTDLPQGTRLHAGEDAVLMVTGLRDPCRLLDRQRPGLMAAVTGRMAGGAAMVRGGIMAVVLTGGATKAGDALRIVLPSPPFTPLDLV